MAKRKSSRRARSRKPSASQSRHLAEPAGAAAAERAQVASETPEAPRERSSSAPHAQAQRDSRIARATEAYERRRDRGIERTRARRGGSRPQAPWHPLPLSELLILVGLAGVVVAWARNFQGSPALVVASIAAIGIGTVEFSLREHLGGYRSHTVLLALIPVAVLHGGVIIVAGAFTTVPQWVNIPLLVVDIAVFALLYKLLRLRYLDARRERRFGGS